MTSIRATRVGEALSAIPWKSWESVVLRGAAFRQMRDLSRKYPQGAFMTLMVVAGLNDYQLKGKAETAYWPQLAEHLSVARVPANPKDLAQLLEPFYATERMPDQKVTRLHRMLESELGTRLWSMSAEEAAEDIEGLWNQIGSVMSQQPTKKTIAFAARLLGSTLVALGQTGFDVPNIPVAVDLRLQRLTPDLDDGDIRTLWKDVLLKIREQEERLTVVHLDSFLWQLSGAEQASAYLREIGLGNDQAGEVSGVFDELAT